MWKGKRERRAPEPTGIDIGLELKHRVPVVRMRGSLLYESEGARGLPFRLRSGTDGKIPLALFTPPGAGVHRDLHVDVFEGEGRGGVIPGSVYHQAYLGGMQHFLGTLGLKGIGYLNPHYEGRVRHGMSAHNVEINYKPDRDDYGIVTREKAFASLRMAERLTLQGVRTEIPEFIIGLDELPIQESRNGPWKAIPIEEVRKRGMIKKTAGHYLETVPVIYGRGLGVPFRVNHLWMAVPSANQLREPTRIERVEMLAKTFHYLNAEERNNSQGTGRPPIQFHEENPHAFLEWFARNLAENLRRMHADGLVHGNLQPYASALRMQFEEPSNVWLDCRLGDLDSPVKPEKSDYLDKKLEKDTTDASGIIEKLTKTVLVTLKDGTHRRKPRGFKTWPDYYKAYFKQVYENRIQEPNKPRKFDWRNIKTMLSKSSK